MDKLGYTSLVHSLVVRYSSILNRYSMKTIASLLAIVITTMSSSSNAFFNPANLSTKLTPPKPSTTSPWDIVEELEAADSHKDNVEQRQLPTDINYYPLIQSLDILSQKVERKMDELNKLSLQLAEAGAGEEIERLVYASEEMKGVLRDARARLEQL
eukprot:scaffold1727_cov198-Alexandrium_tamarense.AAC.12